jgi:Predicted hydrolase of the alpha/beta superfamily
MRPFLFGRSERLLFGTYHAPAVRSARPSAVLLCNPFGQESIRAHRIYATLASKLSKVGQHVLRFDYYGTGDSAGEVGEGCQAGWIEDILEAHEELLASSGVSRVIWVGLRYGATLAVLAGQALRRAIASLILWDPVVDGAAYLQELMETHVTFMRQDMRRWRPSGPVGSESLGFPLGSDLKHAIGAIDLTGAKPPNARQVTVLTTSQKTGIERFRSAITAWTASTHWMEVTTSSPWNSDRALNAILVPMDVLDAIVARVQEIP